MKELIEETLQSAEALLSTELTNAREFMSRVLPEKPFSSQYVRLREWVFTRARVPNGTHTLRFFKTTQDMVSKLNAEQRATYEKALKKIARRRKKITPK